MQRAKSKLKKKVSSFHDSGSGLDLSNSEQLLKKNMIPVSTTQQTSTSSNSLSNTSLAGSYCLTKIISLANIMEISKPTKIGLQKYIFSKVDGSK